MRKLSCCGLGAGLVLLLAGSAMAAPRVDTAAYGVTKDGAQVRAYTLTNDNGVSAKVLDRGGIITEVNVPDRKGVRRNVVLGLGDLKAYESTGNLNSLIGRYANRIRGGFTVDGKHYDLTANPKGVTLHSGRDSYGVRIWSATTASDRQKAAVTLTLISPDGDQGFPGELTIKVTYSLDNHNDLRIGYEATTDKPTIVGLTNHVYFNLAGNGSGSVYDQKLQVFADQYTPVDEDQVPTGVMAPVAGTPFDFRQPRAIGSRVASSEPQMLIGHGYDENFVLRPHADGSAGQAARLYDPASGRILEMRTTEPGLQVYSANGFNGSLVSATGATLRQGAGVALESQHFPGSANIPNFPPVVLRPGQTLRSETIFHFTTDKAQASR